jgi:outer membrane immunogenic protein
MTGSFRGRFCIAGCLATCTLGAAMAADLPPSMVIKAPAAPLQPNWTGAYGGVNIGGSLGHQRSSLDDAMTAARILSNPLGLNGVLGGAQIGYNWQAPDRPWVFGVEADIQGAGQKADGAFALGGIADPGIVTLPGERITYQDKLEWFGTLRGRVGWTMGDQGRILPYVTGGLAYGQGTISGNGSVGGVPLAFGDTHTYVGWTIGGGLEWAFWNSWSAKVEYLYADFGRGPVIALTPTLNLATGRVTDHVGRLGVNYHW